MSVTLLKRQRELHYKPYLAIQRALNQNRFRFFNGRTDNCVVTFFHLCGGVVSYISPASFCQTRKRVPRAAELKLCYGSLQRVVRRWGSCANGVSPWFTCDRTWRLFYLGKAWLTSICSETNWSVLWNSRSTSLHCRRLLCISGLRYFQIDDKNWCHFVILQSQFGILVVEGAKVGENIHYDLPHLCLFREWVVRRS